MDPFMALRPLYEVVLKQVSDDAPQMDDDSGDEVEVNPLENIYG